jgi:hypothetical protein
MHVPTQYTLRNSGRTHATSLARQRLIHLDLCTLSGSADAKVWLVGVLANSHTQDYNSDLINIHRFTALAFEIPLARSPMQSLPTAFEPVIRPHGPSKLDNASGHLTQVRARKTLLKLQKESLRVGARRSQHQLYVNQISGPGNWSSTRMVACPQFTVRAPARSGVRAPAMPTF